MENQHRQIKGYRDLDQKEIDTINAIKQTGEVVKELIDTIKENAPGHDPRWLAIAQTDLQKGFMGLVRSIAQPASF